MIPFLEQRNLEMGLNYSPCKNGDFDSKSALNIELLANQAEIYG